MYPLLPWNRLSSFILHACLRSLLTSHHLSSYSSIGPFIPRLVAQGTLTYPMFTITLQWHLVDVGRNMGIISLGKLPSGVNNNSLTWVKVRGYTTAESAMTAWFARGSVPYPMGGADWRCSVRWAGIALVESFCFFVGTDQYREYFFSFFFASVYLFLSCCKVPQPADSDHSWSIGWRDAFWVLVKAFGQENVSVLGGV